MITLSDKEFRQLIKEVAKEVLSEAGLLKTQISQRQAYQTYGRSRIVKLRQTGHVTPHRQNGRIWYNISEINKATNLNVL